MASMDLQVCPRCGSTDLDLDVDTLKGRIGDGGRVNYVCQRCGFLSHALPMMSEEDVRHYESEKELDWKENLPETLATEPMPNRMYILTGILLVIFIVITITVAVYIWREFF